eukprot:11857551-Heterocapsa_arctica.AAC.1
MLRLHVGLCLLLCCFLLLDILFLLVVLECLVPMVGYCRLFFLFALDFSLLLQDAESPCTSP